jgi:hypothetical protein
MEVYGQFHALAALLSVPIGLGACAAEPIRQYLRKVPLY